MSQPTDDFGVPRMPDAPPAPESTAEQPARKGKSGVILVVLAVVLFLAVGAITGLYVTKTRAAEKTITDQKAQITSLQRDVTAKNDELTKAKADRDKADQDLAAAKSDAAKGAACAQTVKDFFAALRANDDAKAEAAVLRMASACGASLA